MNEDVLAFVLKTKNGDKEAFGEIYKLFMKRIYRFIYYMVYDKELASDLTQNTFLKTWRSINSFSESKGTFEAFLYTIARNVVIDYQRKKKTVSLEVTGDIFPTNENLEESIVLKEEQRIIHKALLGLEDIERHIVMLRYFEELSFAEIAKVIGKNEGAIRVRIHRILQKLKVNLKTIYEN